MARCGCSSTATCSCLVIQGTGTTVTGAGSQANPYIISATSSITASDTATVDLTLTGTDLTATVILDPSPANLLTDINGLLLSCADVLTCVPAATTLTPLDTASVDTTVTGGPAYVVSSVVKLAATNTLLSIQPDGLQLACDDVRGCFTGGDALNYDPVTGDFDLCLSTDPGNIAVLGTDGCLFVAGGGGATVAPLDTNTIDTVVTGGPAYVVSGNVRIDPAAGNILTSSAAGLLADVVTGCGLSGQGTIASPLIANTNGSTWTWPCPDQTLEGRPVYCGPDGALRTDPGVAFDCVDTNVATAVAVTNLAPGVITAVPPAIATLINPSNCRDALAHFLVEFDADVTLQPGAAYRMRIDSDVYLHFVNSGTTTEFFSWQLSRAYCEVIPAGGTLNVSKPLALQADATNVVGGASFNRTQYHVSAAISAIGN